jgi:hypothetical protein
MNPVYNAVVTKFVGPTTHRGQRIVATIGNSRLVHNWTHSLNDMQNYRLAAETVVEQAHPGMLLTHELLAGSLENGYVFLLIEKATT